MSEESTTLDLAAVIGAWFESVLDPDVLLDVSRVGLGSYGSHGGAGVVADWWGNYEEFENKPEEIIDLDNGVVLSIHHQTARPIGVSGQVKRTDAYLFLFEAGACVRWTAYPGIEEGRAAAQRLAEGRG